VSFGFLQFVASPLEIALADHALVPALLCAREFALGGANRNTRHVARLLALQDLATHLDLLATQVGDEAFERGALLLVFVAQARAVECRQFVAFAHRVARVPGVRDGARRGGVERGADGRDDSGLRSDVVKELAAR
jgi:hypothetical protein